MAKTTTVSHRVVVEPSSPIAPSHVWTRDEIRKTELERYERACWDIVQQIERHVDNIKSATVDELKTETCEFCDAPWTEDDDQYNGGCCKHDEDLNKAMLAEPLPDASALGLKDERAGPFRPTTAEELATAINEQPMTCTWCGMHPDAPVFTDIGGFLINLPYCGTECVRKHRAYLELLPSGKSSVTVTDGCELKEGEDDDGQDGEGARAGNRDGDGGTDQTGRDEGSQRKARGAR